MIQVGLFIIWGITLISWLVINILTYRQLMTVVALRTETKWWFIAQVVFSLLFFIIAFASIILIAPLLQTSVPVRSGEFF
ncbi:MAG: hypothetical protein ACK4NC_00175 [Candidatus Gracilibacteria bacterium]